MKIVIKMILLAFIIIFPATVYATVVSMDVYGTYRPSLSTDEFDQFYSDQVRQKLFSVVFDNDSLVHSEVHNGYMQDIDFIPVTEDPDQWLYYTDATYYWDQSLYSFFGDLGPPNRSITSYIKYKQINQYDHYLGFHYYSNDITSLPEVRNKSMSGGGIIYDNGSLNNDHLYFVTYYTDSNASSEDEGGMNRVKGIYFDQLQFSTPEVVVGSSSAVPAPSSFVLLCSGLLAVAADRYRRQEP